MSGGPPLPPLRSDLALGLVNLRDVSVHAPDVAPGRLYRSARWSRATAAGQAALQRGLGEGLIIDLRGADERADEAPLPASWPGWWQDEARLPPSIRGRAWLPMPLLGRRVVGRGVWSASGGRDKLGLLQHRLSGAEQAKAHVIARLRAGGLGQLYLWTLLGGERRFGRALRRLGRPPGPTLVCCAAGKDRTGLLVAVALLIAEVPRPQVLADYAASAAAREALRADRQVVDGLIAQNIDPEPFLDARPEVLDEALDRALLARGGLAGWLRRAGIDGVEQRRIQRALRG